MHRILKKLHSRSGASMMMALLLMLVALMVSAVIIAAAVSSASSVRADREEQQAYLTVSSAAELIRDELANGECNYKSTVVKYYSDSQRQKEVTDKSSDNESFGDVLFSDVLKDALTNLKISSSFHKFYTISVKGQGDADTDYVDVSAEVFLNSDGDGNYSLTVWFEGGDEPNKFRMCLKASGQTTTTGPSNSETTIKEWVEGHYESYYSKGKWRTRWVEGHNDDVTYYLTTTATDVKWQNCKLQRKEVDAA